MLWLIFLLLFFALIIAVNRHNSNKKKYEAGEAGETEVYQMLDDLAPRNSAVLRNVYLPTEKGTTEVDLLFLTRKGIFVFETKNYCGSIYGDERYSQWVKRLGNGKKYSFYNPVWQNEAHIRALLRLFPEISPRCVYSLIVFCGSSEIKKVKIKSRRTKVLKPPELKGKIKWKLWFSLNKFSGKELKYLEEELQKFTDTSRRVKREHRKQIKRLKRRHSA